MNVYEYSGDEVTMTLDGVPLPGVQSLRIEREPVVSGIRDTLKTFEIAFQPVAISVASLAKLLGAFVPSSCPWNEHGASYATLVRRMSYGGRKGRSAERRLAAVAKWLRRFAS